MATVTGIIASADHCKPGAAILLAVQVADPDRITTYTAYDEHGNQVRVRVGIHSNLTLSTDATLIQNGRAPANTIVITSDDPSDQLSIPSSNLLQEVAVVTGSS